MSNDSCRLMVTNLYSFVDNPFTTEARFNLDKFYKVNYEAQRLMDNLVDLELEHIDRIIAKVKDDPEPEHIKRIELNTLRAIKLMGQDGRRTGLGFTGLGDMFAALGVGYGSEKSISIFEDIMRTKMASELDCTTDLAVLRGAFEGWDVSKEFDVLSSCGAPLCKGIDVLSPWGTPRGKGEFFNNIALKFPKEARRMMEYGRRNVSWSTISPTGSVSLLTKTTSGIEPLFQPYYTRRKKINPSDGTSRVDFTDTLGDKWQEYFVLHPKFKDWLFITNNWNPNEPEYIDNLTKDELQEYFKTSPWYNSTANDINWKMRVKMQSVAQKYISHSISSTVNIPSTASLGDVSNIYMEAWRMGSKGITVYRDGSRSGVLVSDTTQTNKFKYYDAVKRPKKIDGEAFLTKVRGDDYTVFVGLIDSKPYEVFAYKGNGIVGKGSIVKKAKGHYMFIKDNDEFEITNNLTDEHEAITRGYSFGLRHGGAIEFAVEQLNKTKGTLVDFNKALARVLKKFIPNESTVSDKTCPSCGEDSLVYEEGCLVCKSCGYGKC